MVSGLVACGSSSPGTTDSAAGGGACGTPATNLAPQIDKVSHAGAPPAMTGGTLVDGTYFLSAMDQYNGENGSLIHQETWIYAAGTLTVLSDEVGKPQIRASGTFTTNGTTVTATLTCGVQATLMNQYTATATTLVTVNQGDANELHTFTKQ